jgi:hypothetical protein
MSRNLQHEVLHNVKSSRSVRKKYNEDSMTYLFAVLNNTCENGMARISSVGIATRYGLGGSGIESGWGRDFPHPSRPALGPILSPIQLVPGLFPEGKAFGYWR